MSIEILKDGISEEQKNQDEQKTREVVSDVLNGIKSRGDSAVREYSEKLDNYSPASFRLSDEQIQDCINQLSDQVIHDIKFAQTQIREFAKAQKDALKDIEVEPIPGVILGHKNIPVQSVGCYVPGGKYPMVASAHMSVVTASVAGVPRIVATTPPYKGELIPAVIAAIHFGGAHEVYIVGGAQAIGMLAYGTETVSSVDMVVGPGNAFVAEAKRQIFGPLPDCSRTSPARRSSRTRYGQARAPTTIRSRLSSPSPPPASRRRPPGLLSPRRHRPTAS